MKDDFCLVEVPVEKRGARTQIIDILRERAAEGWRFSGEISIKEFVFYDSAPGAHSWKWVSKPHMVFWRIVE